MRVCFLIPGQIDKPVGGHKVVYSYANRLSADGVGVVVVNNIFLPSRSSFFVEVLRIINSILKFLKRLLMGQNTCRSWFPLSRNVKETTVWSFDKKCMPQADIYIATAAVTASYLLDYDVPDRNKVYLIQGYENWNMTDEELRKTYHYPYNKIVVSKWLGKILKEEGVEYSFVPNGFDLCEFHCDTPVESKNRYSVSMLYHKHISKGCDIGFAALALVKQRIPQLHVNLFGVFDAPENLPEWYSYLKNPNNELHNRINNESAIYIAPSSMEGWGLTVGEAMMSGQAVACTDTKGYLEMAKDGRNALVSPVNDAISLADNIIRLINDDGLRLKIANNGLTDIASFSVENSYSKFKLVLGL